MSKKQKPYSVLLLYPDYAAATFGHDTYYCFVEAPNAKAAIKKAQIAASHANSIQWDSETDRRQLARDFHPLIVLAGYHEAELLGGE